MIKILLLFLFGVLLFVSSIINYDSLSLLNDDFAESTPITTLNSEIGVKVKYPSDWIVQNTSGISNSVVLTPEVREQFLKEAIKEDAEFVNKYPSNSDKDSYFQEYVSYACGSFIIDCRLISDPYLKNYILDSSFFPNKQLFDYLPSMTIMSPPEEESDRYLENVKITSFVMPDNLTETDVLDYIYSYYQNQLYQITGLDDAIIINQSKIGNYSSYYMGYEFTLDNNLEVIDYVTSMFFIPVNQKMYVVSYNGQMEGYQKHSNIVNNIFNSIELFNPS